MNWEPSAIEWDDQLLSVFPADAGAAVPYATSEASRDLVAELWRYAVPRTPEPEFRSPPQPTSSGRSVLIAGQRGAGKTSTVLWAIREVQAGLIRSSTPVRLLPVPITASMFIKDETPETPLLSGSKTQSRSSAEDTEKKAPVPSLKPREQLLFALCCAMHRELLREFLRSLRARVREIAGDTPGIDHRAADLFELLAQLEHDVEEYIPKRRLRAVWNRLRCLDPTGTGSALFSRNAFGRTLPGSENVRLPRGQAAAELSLLATANELSLRLVGTIFRDGSDNAEMKHSRESALEKTEWRQLLGSLLAGGLIGTGVGKVAELNAFAALFAGVLGTIASALILPLLGSWSHAETYVRRLQFTRDYSIQTLHLEVPRLIDGLKNVGLFPVFIIDELDKHTDLHGKLDPVLKHLKHFFSDRALFCFLTHRQFFDELAITERASPFGVTTTWFGQRCFIEYLPWDLREWVRARMPAESSQERADRTLWEFVLVGRAVSNMAKLQHDLEHVQSDYARKLLRPGQVFDSDFRVLQVEAVFQIISEFVLDWMSVSRSSGNLHLAQLAFSLPLKAWRRGDPFVIGPAARAELVQLVSDSVWSESDHTTPTPKTEINDQQWEILCGGLEALMKLASNANEVSERLAKPNHRWVLEPQVRDAFLQCLPLVKTSENQPRTRETTWLWHDTAGSRDHRQQSERNDDVAVARRRIRLIDDLLKSPGQSIERPEPDGGRSEWGGGPVDFGRLVECGLMSGAPAWTSVRQHLLDLDNSPLPIEQRHDTEDVVCDFAELLEHDLSLFGTGLLIAAAVGQFNPNSSVAERLKAGLTALHERGQPAGLVNRHERRNRLRLIFDALKERRLIEGELEWLHSFDLAFADLRSWLGTLSVSMSDEIRTTVLQKARWQSWQQLIGEWHIPPTADRAQEDATAISNMMLCQSADVTPATLIHSDWQHMSVGQWSRVFVEALVTLDTDDALACPFAAGLLALRYLGFSEELTQRLCSVFAELLAQQDRRWSELAVMNRTELDSSQAPVQQSVSADLVSSPVDSTVTPGKIHIRVILASPRRTPEGMSALAPDPNYPCLCLTPGDLQRLEIWLTHLKKVIHIKWLCVEEPEAGAKESIGPARKLMTGASRPPAAVFEVPPATTEFDWVFRPPAALRDVFDRMQ